MQKQRGIILKTPGPHADYYTLLDQHQGKMFGKTHHSLPLGAVIQYWPVKYHSTIRLEQPEILEIPFSLARQDIFFLHQILEICYYSIVVGVPTTNIFSIIVFLYTYIPLPAAGTWFKKLILYRLFLALGLQPNPEDMLSLPHLALATNELSELVMVPVNTTIEKELDLWLHSCIVAHPYCSYFKTGSWVKYTT